MLNATIMQLFSILIYFIFIIYSIKRRFSIQKHIVCFLFYIYLISVISITIFPIPIQKNLISDMKSLNYLKNNFVPFKSIYNIIKFNSSSTIFKQIAGNILLLMPLSCFLPLISDKKWHGKKVIITGLMCSIGIELTQTIISFLIGVTYKITDIDDVILNFAGVIIGFIIYRLSIPSLKGFYKLVKQ